MRMSTWLVGGMGVATTFIVTGCGNGPTGPTARWSSPPTMSIQTEKQYTALVKTNEGNFTIQLLPQDAPKTVNNFVFLAQHDFYNGDKFFRIIQNFMVQTGDPNNDGTGGPGYTIPDELPPKQPYTAGIVAMARTQAPNSAGSQFFICTVDDTQQLAPQYTEFGKVTSGMDVVKKIAATPVQPNSQTGEMSSPTKDVHIISITVTEK